MGSLFSSFSPPIHTMLVVLLSKIICINFIKRPFQDLARPDLYDVNNAVDVRIPLVSGDEEAELGAWFVRPFESDMSQAQSRLQQTKAKKAAAFLADESEVVVLYLHGNSETRSQGHRRGLYHVFQAMGLPVLAIDYRGFGDSSGLPSSPSETSLVEDSVTAFLWLKARVHPGAKIVVWGHSLGTGVACKMGSRLSKAQEDRPDAYVLESPFDSMLDEVRTFKAGRLLEYSGVDLEAVLADADLEFKSKENLMDVDEPVMIFNAEDDGVIPVELGHALYRKCRGEGEADKSRRKIWMHTFDGSLGLGHDNIYMENSLQVKFIEFLKNLEPDEEVPDAAVSETTSSNVDSRTED